MKRVTIIGGGPAGLMAATTLLEANCEVVLIEQKPTVGRKFLVAGDGGFNLTHSEDLPGFVSRYDCAWIKQLVSEFTPTDFRDFLDQIGIPTIIGSSGKVFPEERFTPAQVLQAWKNHLASRVTVKTNCKLVDFQEGNIQLLTKEGLVDFPTDFVVLALGSVAWPVTGSDGNWLSLFAKKGIAVTPFQASNSGVVLYENWLGDLEGKVLKNIRATCGEQSCAGDIVCTQYGLEGKPIYAINRELRKMERPIFKLDFKPQMSVEKMVLVLKKAKTPSQGLKDLKLSEIAQFWLKKFVSKDRFIKPDELAKSIKEFTIGVQGFRPLDEVISCAGGVSLNEISASGELNQFPTVFCAGEMVDWDAPTGGYLIQGCVSSGYAAGKTIAIQLSSIS